MSMSTGDVQRGPLNKITIKATATGGKKPPVRDADGVLDGEAAGSEATGSEAAEPEAADATTAASAAETKPTARQSSAAKPSAAKSSAARSGAARPGAAAKPGARATGTGNRPGGRGPTKATGPGGRRPTVPVKVNQTRNWGPLVMFGGAGLAALLIIGFGAYALLNRPDPTKWQERADAIVGIVDYNKTQPELVKSRDHKPGVLTYPMSPPVGGAHNPQWQNCMGDVYAAPVAKEHAVHSLEHGAVWVTYNPSLPADQVAELKSKVEGKSFMLMSPYPGLDQPISLQAWGYQLKVGSASDGRIDDFITDLRQNASKEPGAGCSGGITEPSNTPFDLSTGSNPTP